MVVGGHGSGRACGRGLKWAAEVFALQTPDERKIGFLGLTTRH